MQFFAHPNMSQKKAIFNFARKRKLPARTDLFITNVENWQELNEKDSLKGQIKHPQIPYINLFVSNPNGKHDPVMLRAMPDSGLGKGWAPYNPCPEEAAAGSQESGDT